MNQTIHSRDREGAFSKAGPTSNGAMNRASTAANNGVAPDSASLPMMYWLHQ